MNYKEKQKLKNEIKLSVYNHLIDSIMSGIDDYEKLSPVLKLQVNIIMRHSSTLSKKYVS